MGEEPPTATHVPVADNVGHKKYGGSCPWLHRAHRSGGSDVDEEKRFVSSVKLKPSA